MGKLPFFVCAPSSGNNNLGDPLQSCRCCRMPNWFSCSKIRTIFGKCNLSFSKFSTSKIQKGNLKVDIRGPLHTRLYTNQNKINKSGLRQFHIIVYRYVKLFCWEQTSFFLYFSLLLRH